MITFSLTGSLLTSYIKGSGISTITTEAKAKAKASNTKIFQGT